jgi:hypothetical protein
MLRARFVGRPADALAEELGPFARDPTTLLPELEAVLPGPPRTPLEPDQEKHRLFHALTRFFVERASAQSLLVVVDRAARRGRVWNRARSSRWPTMPPPSVAAGGFVALTLAVRHPDVFGRLILMNTAAATADMADSMSTIEQRYGARARATAERMFSGDFSEEVTTDLARYVAPVYPPFGSFLRRYTA